MDNEKKLIIATTTIGVPLLICLIIFLWIKIGLDNFSVF